MLARLFARGREVQELIDVWESGKQGEARDELLALIDEEEQISLLVLGADTNSETAGPLINFLMSKGAARCRVPITVVPGNLTDDPIDALF